MAAAGRAVNLDEEPVLRVADAKAHEAIGLEYERTGGSPTGWLTVERQQIEVAPAFGLDETDVQLADGERVAHEQRAGCERPASATLRQPALLSREALPGETQAVDEASRAGADATDGTRQTVEDTKPGEAQEPMTSSTGRCSREAQPG